MMKQGGRIHVVVLAAACCCCAPVWAGVANGGFETGDLTGWTYSGAGPNYDVDPFGDPGAVTSEMSRDFLAPIAPDWTPTEGDYFASLWSTNGQELGATLSQTFSAEAGLVLRFDYFFDFGDTAPYYDTATATLSWLNESIMLFEHNTSGHELNDDENVGWMTVAYALPVTDAYVLAFAVTDYDGYYESILGVDNVRVDRCVIPVPGALLLASLGVGCLSRFRRDRNRELSL